MEGLGSTFALLRAEVLFIDFNLRCELTPLPPRTSEDVPKLYLLDIQKGGVIKCACWHGADAWNCLQYETKI